VDVEMTLSYKGRGAKSGRTEEHDKISPTVLQILDICDKPYFFIILKIKKFAGCKTRDSLFCTLFTIFIVKRNI
jgi:hypothetical protein